MITYHTLSIALFFLRGPPGDQLSRVCLMITSSNVALTFLTVHHLADRLFMIQEISPSRADRPTVGSSRRSLRTSGRE